MNKIVSLIRDLDIIEKELADNPVGVLVLMVEDDKLVQIATPYLYVDKNVFVFIEDEELIENIQFGTSVSFTIVKSSVPRKSSKLNFTPTYRFLSVSVLGIIKKVEEQKTVDELKQIYTERYSDNSGSDLFEFPEKAKLLIIDSEEIKAFEEIGG